MLRVNTVGLQDAKFAALNSFSFKVDSPEKYLRILQYSLLGLQVIAPGLRELHLPGRVVQMSSIIQGLTTARHALWSTICLSDLYQIAKGQFFVPHSSFNTIQGDREAKEKNLAQASFFVGNLFFPLAFLSQQGFINMGVSAQTFTKISYYAWTAGASFELMKAVRTTAKKGITFDTGAGTRELFGSILSASFDVTTFFMERETSDGIKALVGISSAGFSLLNNEKAVSFKRRAG
jgi:hypothetical protein